MARGLAGSRRLACDPCGEKSSLMLMMAHPAVLRDVIAQDEALTALHTSAVGNAEVRQRMDGVRYVLCMSTGTCEWGTGQPAAVRRRLTGAELGDDSLPAGA